jgi:sulfur relay (sulfurtransferase) DsrC/TusE family protein
MEDWLRTRQGQKKINRRKKRYYKKVRKQDWNDLKISIRSFFKHTLSYNLNHEQRYLRAKARKENQKNFKKRFLVFLKNPLSFGKKVTREQKYLQKRYRREQKRLFNQKVVRFFKDPFSSFRTPDDIKFIRKKIKKERIRKMNSNFIHFFRLLKESAVNYDLRKKHFTSFVVSTSYFVLSFLLFFIINQLLTILSAHSFTIPSTWNYFEVKFPISDLSNLWTRKALVTIFAVGPIVCILLALLALRLFLIEKASAHYLRLFFSWCILQGANFFFGAYIVGMVTRSGFIYSSEWIFMSNMFDVEEIIFSVIAFFFMLITGKYIIRAFLMSSLSATLIRPQNRVYYVISTIFLPWLTGSIILFFLMAPKYPITVSLMLLAMLIPIVNIFVHYNDPTSKNIVIQVKTKFRYRKLLLFLLVVVLIIYRLALNSYIHIG